MGKTIIRASAINVTTHPHSPQGYIDLFKVAHENKSYHQTSDHIFRIDLLTNAENNKYLSGMLMRFVNIEDYQWYNETQRRAASDDERAKISIPAELKPNIRYFSFYFDPKAHTLIVQRSHRGDAITPGKAASIFGSILNSDRTRATPEVRVQPVCNPGKLAELLNVPDARKLEVTINKPNSDITDEINPLEQELGIQNAASAEYALSAESGKYLKFSQRTRALIKAATRHGKASIVSDSAPNAPISTEDLPYVEQDRYSSKNTDFQTAFRALATKMVSRVVELTKKDE